MEVCRGNFYDSWASKEEKWFRLEQNARRVEQLKILLSAGANMNAITRIHSKESVHPVYNQKTALHYAVWTGGYSQYHNKKYGEDVLDVLLNFGGLRIARDSRGNFPWDYDIYWNKARCERRLKTYIETHGTYTFVEAVRREPCPLFVLTEKQTEAFIYLQQGSCT